MTSFVDRQDNFRVIAALLGKHSRKITDEEQTVKNLCNHLTDKGLAIFIVNAYNRGWITNFNLGLNDEGEPI